MEPKRNNGKPGAKRSQGGSNKNKNKTGISITPVPLEPERFEVGDEKAMEFLKENGFVVFKDVANKQELETGESLLWQYLSESGVVKDDLSTYNWVDPFRKGIVPGNGIGHSAFMWHCRGLPKVKQIYSAIWGTDELMTSFDGCCIHKPWEHNDSWKYTEKTWFHLDQNGIDKPGMVCVQGFLNFLPAGSEDGGLCIVARSHKIFGQFFRDRPQMKGKGDWVMVENDKQLWDKIRRSDDLQTVKICCGAGDFVLWDSRIIHSGYASNIPRPLPEDGSCLPLRRLVAYICMTPTKRANVTTIQKRIEAYYNGWTTSHWPEDCSSSGVRRQVSNGFKPPELTPEQKALIPMLD